MQKSFSILFVSQSWYPARGLGGPIFSNRAIVSELVSLGHTVRVFTTNQRTRSDPKVPANTWHETDGIPTYVSQQRCLDLVQLSYQISKVDLVHISGLFVPVFPPTTICAQLLRVPVVVSPRGVIEPWSLAQRPTKKRIALSCLRPMTNRVHLWHATSHTEEQSVRKVMRTHRVTVIPNGVSLSSSKPYVFSGRRGMIALGRIHPKKSLETVIQAVSQLDGVLSSLRIIGPIEDASYASFLRNLIAELAIDCRVSIEEPLYGEQKLRALRSASVLVLSSKQENFGNVIVEALAQGTPCIASHETPWAVLEASGAGRHVSRTPSAFAEAAKDLCSSPERWRRSSEAAQRLARESFAWDVQAKKMVDAYKYVLAAQARDAPTS